MKVAVIAFGTRGDVQPLVLLAAGVASSSWCREVVLVTHEDHAGFIEALLKLQFCESPPKIAPVDSPPVLWKGTSRSDAEEARANLAQQNGCLEACRGANLVVFNMFAMEGFHVSEAYRIPCAVCHPYLTTATSMPSSFPAKMRRAYPRLFRRLTLLSETPNAVRGATATTSDKNERRRAAERRGGRAETAWTHVEHWMWPLFTDKWGPFRERLGLHPCPFEEDRAEGNPEVGRMGLSAPSEGAANTLNAIDPSQLPLVLYLFSPLVVDASPFWPESVRICGYLFPTPAAKTPPDGGLGASHNPSLSQSPIGPPSANERHPQEPHLEIDLNLAFPPSSPPEDGNNVEARAGGEGDGAACGEVCDLPPEVAAFLTAREDRDRPIYVGFGSMWGMCLPGYRMAFALRVLLLGARQAGCRCIVNLPSRGGVGVRDDTFRGIKNTTKELDTATRWVLGEFTASAAHGDLLVYQGPLAHNRLLPRCSLAIHHGGSGTTAAVLRSGIPQVVCPQHLDQFFWAERVRYLAVGSVLERSLFLKREPAPTEPPGPIVCQAAAAILSALTPQTKLRAACLGVKIRAERGLENAVESLSLFARKGHPMSPAAAAAAASTRQRQRPQSRSLGARTVCTAIPTPADAATEAEEFCQGKAGGIAVPAGGVLDGSPQEGAGSGSGSGSGIGSVRFGEETGREKLVLREMPNGLKVWWASSAEEEAFFIFGEIFEDRTYARMGIRVQDGDTVWDVGANVGLASIFFELETDIPDSLHVYAFEPLPVNRTALRRNMSEHCPNAKVLEYALGAKHEDDVPATFYPRMPGNSTFRPVEKERLQGGMGNKAGQASKSFFEDAQQVACSVRTVSWAMSNLGVDRIDLLKIDVEGVELDVLCGVGDQDWPKIKQVVAEVHPVGDRVAQACKMLRRHGFHVSAQALGLDGTPLSPGGGVAVSLPSRDDRPGCSDQDRDECRLQEDAARDGVVFMVYAKRA